MGAVWKVSRSKGVACWALRWPAVISRMRLIKVFIAVNLRLEVFFNQYKVICFVVFKNISQKWAIGFRTFSAVIV